MVSPFCFLAKKTPELVRFSFQPVFQLEPFNACEMTRVAADQGHFIGYGNSGKLKVRQVQRGSRFFEFGPKIAAYISGFGVKAENINEWKQNFFKIV